MLDSSIMKIVPRTNDRGCHCSGLFVCVFALNLHLLALTRRRFHIWHACFFKRTLPGEIKSVYLVTLTVSPWIPPLSGPLCFTTTPCITKFKVQGTCTQQCVTMKVTMSSEKSELTASYVLWILMVQFLLPWTMR